MKKDIKNENEDLDIPFVEDKNDESIDMTIFKMNEDDDLYDDDNYPQNENQEGKPNKKKFNVTVIVLSVLLVVMIALAAFSVFYAFKEHNRASELDKTNQSLLANENVYKQQISEKDNQIASLTKQINDAKQVETVSDTYEIIDGPINFRKSPNSSSEKVAYKGADYAFVGDEFKVVEISKDSSGNKWAKVADGVYFCIGTDDDPWAKKN